MTRLEKVRVAGFRAFAGEAEFDLDADAVIVVGRNGQGKTSLFDAVLWALTGAIPRLGQKESAVSLYSQSGEARVELNLRTSDGRTVQVVRSSAGGLSVVEVDRDLRAREAEDRLLRILWPEALSASEPQEALGSAIERSVYLQQDRVREFVDAQSERERFVALSELMGAGRVVELQQALERSRLAWSRATNVLREDAEAARRRLQSLEVRAAEIDLSAPPAAVGTERWNRWWAAVRAADVVDDAIIPSPTSASASTVLDNAIRAIDATQSTLARRRESLDRVVANVVGLRQEGRDAPDIEQLRRRLQSEEMSLSSAIGDLREAQEASSQHRARQVAEEDRRARLATMAELAVQFLGDTCPVCAQDYDYQATVSRLQQLMGEADEHPSEAPDDAVSELAERVREIERRIFDLQAELRLRDHEAAAWRSAWDESVVLSSSLDVDPSPPETWVDRLNAAIQRTESLIDQLTDLRREGEQLALVMARLGELTRQAELRTDIEVARSEVAPLQAEVERRERTSDLISSMMKSLRQSISEVVVQQLDDLAPLLQRVYSSVDPHPSLTVAQLIASMKGGRGSIVASVSDPIFGVSTNTPTAFLSSSQVNVLAVSVFLAVNLRYSRLPLHTVLLDDPLQSLDDVNLLGLWTCSGEHVIVGS